MCSPAPVISQDLQLLHIEPQPRAPRHRPAAFKLTSLQQELQHWLSGWKQTLIAEVAALGLPKEGFL
jgi:hypothetical protein